MKIALVNDYGYRAGGAETYFFALADELKRQNHDVITISSKYKNQKKIETNFQVQESGHIFNSDSIFNLVNYFELKRIFNNFKPDFIHYHNVFYQLSAAAIFAGSRFRRILTLHDYKGICLGDKRLKDGSICQDKLSCCKKGCLSLQMGLVDKLRRKSIHSALHKIDTLIAPSNFIAEQFKLNGFNNIKYFPHPLSLGCLESKLSKCVADKKDFIYCGRLAEQKGVDILIKAFARLGETTALLHIVGDGPEKENLVKLCEQLDCAKRVIFHGYLEGEKKNQLLSKSFAHILPSIWPEVRPIIVGEVASLGTVNIVSAVGGLVDMVNVGSTGFNFPSGDIEALVALLKFCFENPQKLNEIAANSQKESQINSMEKHVLDLLMLIEK